MQIRFMFPVLQECTAEVDIPTSFDPELSTVEMPSESVEGYRLSGEEFPEFQDLWDEAVITAALLEARKEGGGR